MLYSLASCASRHNFDVGLLKDATKRVLNSRFVINHQECWHFVSRRTRFFWR